MSAARARGNVLSAPTSPRTPARASATTHPPPPPHARPRAAPVRRTAHSETIGPSEVRAGSKRGQRRLTRRLLVSRCKDAQRFLGDRRLEEPARALMCAPEPVEVGTQAHIARA